MLGIDKRAALRGLHCAMSRRRDFTIVLTLLACLTVSTGARIAGATAETASQFIESVGQQVVDVLQTTQPTDQERHMRFRSIFTEAFDVELISRFVLGRHWQKMTPEQETEYSALFADYVVEIYAHQFDKYSGQTFEIVSKTELSETDTLVTLQILREGGPPLPIDFRVKDNGSALKIVDTAVEGVSLIVTKRSEFSAVVGREGIEGLLGRLRQALS